jgi:hypothetical protein
MAKTAIALYQTLIESRQVVEELATSGYSRADIQIIDQDQPDVMKLLTGAGLPPADAEAYREGLQHGAHLVMLTTTDDMIDAAVYVMESYKSINIHDQQAPWQPNSAAEPLATANHGQEAGHNNEEIAPLPAVEEGIRYEEYQDAPGEARSEAVIEAELAKEKITPRQEYVEESVRR